MVNLSFIRFWKWLTSHAVNVLESGKITMTKVVQQLKHIETDENQFFPIWITLKWIFQLVIKCSFTCTWNGSRVRKCSHKNRAMTTFPAALILISIFVSYVNTTKSIGTVTRHWALLSAQAPVRISSATAAALVPVCNVEWVKSKVNIYTVLPQKLDTRKQH